MREMRERGGDAGGSGGAGGGAGTGGGGGVSTLLMSRMADGVKA